MEADGVQKISVRRRYGPLIYFAVLLAALLVVFLPSFTHPPRSDYWSAFYVFQRAAETPGWSGWKSILTFDLWEHGTYRPLSHLIPYLEHLVFSPRFVWNHVLNFAAYFLSIVLLYLLAGRLGLDRGLTAIFLAVFAFLYSHSDIAVWTFQFFTIISFCGFLLGFILYIDYLRSGRAILLLAVGALFLFGMLTLEVYALWPLAIFILPFALPSPRRRFRWRDAAPLLVYPFYLGGWLLHRGTTGELPSPTAGQLATGFLLVFFNLAYTGFAVNIVPSLSRPLYLDDNINMGGWVWRLEEAERLDFTVAWMGGAVLLLLLLGAWCLYRKGRRRLLVLLSLFFFLYLTDFFIAGTARITSDRAFYPLVQFRYQYVPNAFLALMLAAVLGGLLKPRIRGKTIIGLILIPVLVFNMSLGRRQIAELGDQLRLLGMMINHIRRGLSEGIINEDARLYIAPRVRDRVGRPGWNHNMGRFMEGTFHWFFLPRERGKFTLEPEEAAWIVSWDSFPLFVTNPGGPKEDE